MTDYSMEGHTYRYFKKTPLYPFGYGLSYSKFQYLDVTYIPEIRAGDNQYIYGTVMNIGDVDAYEVCGIAALLLLYTWVKVQNFKNPELSKLWS